VLATFVFVVAVALINHAYSRTLEAALYSEAGRRDVRAHSSLLLDSQDGQQDWGYANYSSRPLSLSSGGSINATKAAHLVAMLSDNESAALAALSAGPYRVGINITAQDGSPVTADCPGCACGGRCSVSLQYLPEQDSGNIYKEEGTYRLVNCSGAGAGIARVQLLFYRTYD
jgi:hypothetical protein